MLADAGLLLIRLVVGGIMIAHGLQKFGYLGGGGLDGTAGFLEGGLGFRPGRVWAHVVRLAEAGGGALIVLGLAGPLGPMLVIADMLVAIVSVHWAKGFFNGNGGIEFPLLLAATSAGLALIGFGAWSLDALLAIVAPGWLVIAALVVAVVGAGVTLVWRRRGGPAGS